jgi:hypothetical protein
MKIHRGWSSFNRNKKEAGWFSNHQPQDFKQRFLLEDLTARGQKTLRTESSSVSGTEADALRKKQSN